MRHKDITIRIRMEMEDDKTQNMVFGLKHKEKREVYMRYVDSIEGEIAHLLNEETLAFQAEVDKENTTPDMSERPM